MTVRPYVEVGDKVNYWILVFVCILLTVSFVASQVLNNELQKALNKNMELNKEIENLHMRRRELECKNCKYRECKQEEDQ